MSKQRDEKGRFISELRDDAESVFSICVIIYKLIPLVIIGVLAFKYFDIFKFINEILMIIGCGNSNCKCVCSNGSEIKADLKDF